MTPLLTPLVYEQTKKKLAGMEARLISLRQRKDLDALRKTEVERSYLEMMRQYRRALKLYEATCANMPAGQNP
jgi:hypothetical protein